MKWHRIQLNRKSVAAGAMETIERILRSAVIQHPTDASLAAYDCESLDGELTEIYLSPSLSFAVADKLPFMNAEPSDRPSGSEPEFDVLVAVDDDRARSLTDT